MSNKLSNSSVDKYMECSLCWKLHYLDGIRPIRGKSALLFGSALDTALNHLLLNRNFEESRDIFIEQWEKVDPDMTDFSKSDFDEEVFEFYSKGRVSIVKAGENKSWRSLLYKGCLFIKAYYHNVLPRIKEVITVQEPVSLKNEEGDEITGFLDLIVKWEDGKTYLLDNKSSSVKYEQLSAKTGQQLPLYYYIVKEKYKLDGVGYIVLSKKINKNKVKTCKKCQKVNEGTHKTCPNVIDLQHNVRCNGEFDVTINPSVDLQFIFNEVEESDEQRVLDKFDEVNYNVSNGYFATEHNPNRNKFFQYCPYREYYDGHPGFIKKENK